MNNIITGFTFDTFRFWFYVFFNNICFDGILECFRWRSSRRRAIISVGRRTEFVRTPVGRFVTRQLSFRHRFKLFILQYDNTNVRRKIKINNRKKQLVK